MYEIPNDIRAPPTLREADYNATTCFPDANSAAQYPCFANSQDSWRLYRELWVLSLRGTDNATDVACMQ